MDLLKQAVCNELRATLARWDLLNDMLTRGEAVDKNEHTNLRLKIQSLEHRLDVLDAREVA